MSITECGRRSCAPRARTSSRCPGRTAPGNRISAFSVRADPIRDRARRGAAPRRRWSRRRSWWRGGARGAGALERSGRGARPALARQSRQARRRRGPWRRGRGRGCRGRATRRHDAGAPAGAGGGGRGARRRRAGAIPLPLAGNDLRARWRMEVPSVPMGTGLVDIFRYAHGPARHRIQRTDGTQAEYPLAAPKRRRQLTLPREMVMGALKRDVLTIRAALDSRAPALLSEFIEFWPRRGLSACCLLGSASIAGTQAATAVLAHRLLHRHRFEGNLRRRRSGPRIWWSGTADRFARFCEWDPPGTA